MNNKEMEVLRTQAWNYFEYHAAQRLTTFNFYLTLSSLISSALFLSLNNANLFWVSIFLGFLLITFSFIFQKLDRRNRDLIRGAEEALKYFEKETKLPRDGDLPHITKIFSREEILTKKKKAKKSWLFWNNYLTYSDSFSVIYFGFGIIGAIGVILSLVKLI